MTLVSLLDLVPLSAVMDKKAGIELQDKEYLTERTRMTMARSTFR